MKNLIQIASLTLVTFLGSGCTTVQYNGTTSIQKSIDYPEIGQVITVYVGDHMVQKGIMVEEDFLLVTKTVDGALYDIPANKYAQLGFDNIQDFYSATGVVRSAFADPFNALSIKKNQNTEICVITVFGGSACYPGEFERRKQISERGNSFQQTLIYSGRVGNKINIGYREFSNNTARPAFNNNVEYDLSSSNTIGYKGAFLEVIKADNSSITYKLIKNFP